MPKDSTPNTKRTSRQRLYRALLRLLPFDFQREYGSEMEEVFQEESAAIEEEAGSTVRQLWWRTAQGMTRTALSEHFYSLWGDIRHGVRTLAKTPGFTFVAVAMLALGIGVNTAVFRVTDAVLFKGFSGVQHNERLVYIANGYGCCVSGPDFQDWKAQARSFQGMAAVRGTGVTLSSNGGFPERESLNQISSNTFALVGVKPFIGRDFLPADEIPGAPQVVILRYEFWAERFGKAPGIVGQTVRINSTPATIIGIMPERFSFPQNAELWMPLVPTADLQRRDKRNLWCIVARLSDGVSLEAARGEMDVIGRRLALEYPETDREQLPIVQRFDEFFVSRDAAAIYGALWAAVGLVLLIACANLANLLVARSIARTREVSIRIALGAGRWRIIRQLLIESMMIAAGAGVAGWYIAQWSVYAYEWGGRSWRILDYSTDYRVFAYLAGISAVTGVLFGLAPALRLSRLDVQTALKDGGRASGQRHKRRLSSLLVATEMALAVILLAAAGVTIRSFIKLATADLGINTGNVLQMSLSLPVEKYPNPAAQISFSRRLTERLSALPGIQSVTVANNLPANNAMRMFYALPDDAPSDEQHRPTLLAMIVGPGYFRTLGAAVLSGREFNDSDRIPGVPSVIVNEKFAARYWPRGNPLGQHLRVFNRNVSDGWLTVVGVVSNITQNSDGREQFEPLIYLPYLQNPIADVHVFAKTLVPPESLGPAVRREMQALDPDLPAYSMSSLDLWFHWMRLDRSVVTSMFLIFATIALLLASLGLYAVIAHSVNQRTQEIGIRIAIGATRADIRHLVFRAGMIPLATGLVIGLAASIAVNRILGTILVQVSPSDPLSLTLASAVLVFAATLGCWIPARRAMRVDPVIALRHE